MLLTVFGIGVLLFTRSKLRSTFIGLFGVVINSLSITFGVKVMQINHDSKQLKIKKSFI